MGTNLRGVGEKKKGLLEGKPTDWKEGGWGDNRVPMAPLKSTSYSAGEEIKKGV